MSINRSVDINGVDNYSCDCRVPHGQLYGDCHICQELKALDDDYDDDADVAYCAYIDAEQLEELSLYEQYCDSLEPQQDRMYWTFRAYDEHLHSLGR